MLEKHKILGKHNAILDKQKMVANPNALAIVQKIYNKYSPSKKQRFVSNLKGQKDTKESILIDMTLEDSREFQKALSKIKYNNIRIFRLGRGARHGIRKYCSYLPLPLAERVSIYAYLKHDKWVRIPLVNH